MMNIIIKETGEKETLALIMNGVDCSKDVIGNHDGFGSDDHQFEYDADIDAYVATQDTFDWWNKVIADQQGLEDRIADLKAEHGSDAVYSAIGNAGDCDLEYHASAINAALDEVFGQ